MPFVEIHLRRGRNPEQLRDIADGVHAALVSEAAVPPDDRFQVIHELPEDRLFAHHSYGGVSRSENVVIVQITLNAGRTLEVKKALYARMARNLEEIGVRPDDLLVSLIEVTKENWSFGGGRATYGDS